MKLNGPVMLLMLGLPGAGKSYFARQFARKHNMAYISDDRIRYELYDDPQYTTSENALINRLMDIAASEALLAQANVVYDGNLYSRNMREIRRKLARKINARTLTVWVQTDVETAFYRATHRDRRRPDDKFVPNVSREVFESAYEALTRPDYEDYVVISGKHSFSTQAKIVEKKLITLGVAEPLTKTTNLNKAVNKKMPSSSGRFDYQRRLPKR